MPVIILIISALFSLLGFTGLMSAKSKRDQGKEPDKGTEEVLSKSATVIGGIGAFIGSVILLKGLRKKPKTRSEIFKDNARARMNDLRKKYIEKRKKN
jgi:hypothetical protein